MRNATARRDPEALREAIKTAYRDLRTKGYFCRSAFWCCSTCALAAIPDEGTAKYVFYHRQDASDINRRGHCYLAWAGSGSEIVTALQAAGLKVEWDGDEATRILVSLT